MIRRQRTAFPAVALLASLVLLAGCAKEPTPPTPPKVVRVLVAGQTEITDSQRYSGEVRARYETTLGFRVGGKLVARSADVGTPVKAGQALARLDPADAALQAAQAEAQRALAAADLKRFEDLRSKNFVSQSALDARITAAKAADAQAALARNQTGYATLFADHPGVIAAVLAEPGQVVAAGQGVFRLARDGDREVAISVPESDVARLKVGSPAEVNLWAAPGKPYRGEIREISPIADPATRTYPIRVRLVQTDSTPALGMTASVRFSGAAAPALTIPLTALYQQDGGGAAVWIVGAEQTVSLRPVRVARYADAGVEIVEGLAPGERIVAAGVHKLSAGEKVRIAEPGR